MRAEKMIHLDSLAYSYVPFQPKIGLRHQKRYPCMIVLDASHAILSGLLVTARFRFQRALAA